MRITLLLGLLASGAAHAQDVECPTTPADLESASDRAIEAFVAMDVAQFKTEHRAASKVLRCLAEPLNPSQAAAWHRLMALGAFLDRDQETTIARFQASRLVAPNERLPGSIAPEGHPLDKLFQQADPELSGAIEPLDVPEGGRAWLDGEPDAAVRPIDRPSVLQLARPDGLVVETRDLVAGSPSPDWSGFDFTPDDDESEPAPEPTPTTTNGPHVGLAVAAGVAAAASLGTFAAASASRASFNDPKTAYGDLEGLRSRTNGLTAASGVAAVGAVGLGVAAFTVSF